jgi:hypothetical protein
MINYFFAIEQTLAAPATSGVTSTNFTLGHATRPHGALTQQESASGGGITNNATIYASDSGYCSRPSDPGGPQAYPPRVQEAFAVDALVNLDPAASAVGAGWGAIKLANNDSRYDSILTGGWFADSLATKILYGQKTLEAFDGYASARTAAGTRVDPNNVVQTAAPATLRQDYASAITIDANSTNVIRNSAGGGSVTGTIGSGGAMPPAWTVNVPGLATDVSSYRATLPGLGAATVVRLRFHGITTATSGSVSYGTTGSMSGLLYSQSIAQSLYVALVAGSFANLTQLTHYLVLYDATAIAVGVAQPNILPGFPTTLTRLFRTANMPATGNQPFATSNPSLIFYWPTGSAVDFTLDVCAPQLERGTVPTAYIATTAGDVTHGDGGVNYIPTSDMTGLVVGTPGTLPNGWSVNLGGGISQQITQTGTDATTGYKFIDIRFFGTATSTLTNLHFCAGVDACQSQAWTVSVYASFIAGSQAGVSFTLGVQETDSVGAFLAFPAETAKPLNTNVIWRSRRIASIVTAQATTRSLSPSLWISYASGAAIDFTMRLMAPQLEGGTVASSFVPTTTGPVSRAATYTITDAPVTLNELAATNYVLSTGVPGPITGVGVAASTDVPAVYAARPVWKHVRTTTGTDSNSGMIGCVVPSTGMALRASAWIWIPSSMASNKTLCHLHIEGTGVANAVYSNTSLALVDQWQRVSCTATIAAGSTAPVLVLRIYPQIAGDVVYTSGWQLEVDRGAMTSFIPPATTPAVRDADNLYTARNILIDPPYASLVPAFNGVAGTITSDDTQITIPLRDASYWLERPLVRATYGGTGQYDGTTALTGSLKPLVIGGGQGTITMYGPAHNITPVLIDPPALIYQVSDGAIGKLATLYEGGKGGGWAFAGDVPDLYVGSTPSGSYRTCLARGCFQLGSTPTYAITCDVNGATLPGTPAPVSPDTLAVAAYALTTLCGVPASLLAMNGNSLAAVGATAPVGAGCALYLAPGDSIDGLTLLTRILAPLGVKLVACRDGLLRAYCIAALPAHPTPKATLDDRTIVSITPIALPAGVSPIPYRMRVGYNDNYTVQTTDLSPLVDATRKQYLATEQSIAQSNAPANYSANARTNDPPIISGSIVDSGVVLNAQLSAQAAADTYIKLWGVRRQTYGIVVPFTVGIALEYGDVVSITADAGDLTGTVMSQVVGYSYKSEDSSITLRLLV